MDERTVSEQLCEVGRRVWQRGYVASNDGNFSARLPDGRIVCTPTGVSKGFMRPEDMVTIDLEGRPLAGERRATSEIRLHLFIYRERPNVRAVVHAHPPHATAFAVARRRLPRCVLPEIEVFLGEIPTTDYRTPGTWEFAETLRPYIRGHVAWLLQSHGVATCGNDPFEAYYRLESVDHYCHILINAAQVGGWEQLRPEEVGSLLEIRRKMGLPDLQSGGDLGAWCAADSSGREGGSNDRQVDRERLRRLVSEVVRRLREG